MKKKLALLMAAIMTVAMVPATAFASTKLTAVDEVTTGVDDKFVSTVELRKNDDQVDISTADYADYFEVTLKLTNAKFTKDDDDNYIMDTLTDITDAAANDANDDGINDAYAADAAKNVGIDGVEVLTDTTATVRLDTTIFNRDGGAAAAACVLNIAAKAVAAGDVTVSFTSNVPNFKSASEVIAKAVEGDAEIAIDGVTTFVEDGDNIKEIKDITINGLSNASIEDNDITLKLKGNYEFSAVDKDGNTQNPTVTLLNDAFVGSITPNADKDELVIEFTNAPDADMLAKITISNVYIKALKDCDAGDVATITVSSKDFDSVKLEVAKMVEEAVTYSVEDKDLPTIWAGKLYDAEDEANTLKLSVVENTGDILNTSRKATFTFPEGIEVVDIASTKGLTNPDFKYEIDENVVTIYNYSKGDVESKKVDMSLKFILTAAPTFSGDVTVTLGGQFDDTSFKVATVKAPYTVTAKTSEVLIDYRYVPVNDIVITEAEDGILEDGDKVILAVEKMDFEDAGDVEVTEGDIDVDVDIDDEVLAPWVKSNYAYLTITVKDASTEASTMVISGLELYLDRTLPVGGYALQNVTADNILWQNSTGVKVSDTDTDAEAYELAYDYTPETSYAVGENPSNGLFKYKEVTINDEYVNVITAARDQDDSMTTKKIVITVGATTMAAGTETVTLDAPAYINSANYTMLPLRAISEAFGATVNWDDATKTVTILSGQRIISMTIGSKTMYINGTPVAMNTAAEVTSARTFVPVRDLANSLGISNINWTEASGTVTLN